MMFCVVAFCIRTVAAKLAASFNAAAISFSAFKASGAVSVKFENCVSAAVLL